jgi:hypothetical protein
MPPISTKRALASRHKSLNIEKHDIGHSGPGLRQAQKCGRDKPVNGNMLWNKQLNWCQYCKILQLQNAFTEGQSKDRHLGR